MPKPTSPLLALLLALATPLASAASPPPAFTAEYEVLRNGNTMGRAEVRLEALADGRYRLVNQTRGTRGMAALAGVDVTEESEFRWRDGGPETLGYRYRQQASLGRGRERAVEVDAAAGRVTSIDRDRRHSFELKPGTLDRQLVSLAIGADLAAGRRGELAYRVIDRDDDGEQRFRVVGPERIDLPTGSTEAIRVERIREDASRQTQLWLDPARNWLTVRSLQQERNGDRLELRLVALRKE